MSDLRKAVLGRHAKKTILGPSSRNNNFDPVKWTEYFEAEETITTPQGKFHIYKRGTEGPVIFCLHGGGYSALTWSLLAMEISSRIECRVIALDIRGHGNTVTDNDGDLSLDTMALDVKDVISTMFYPNEPPIVMLGHSMGGALAVHVAQSLKCVAGLCVIDVVEGTALDALSSMQSLLRGRPSMFKSIPHAIQWCYKGGQTSNLDAAKVSMPGQIVNMETKQLASYECDNPDSKMPIIDVGASPLSEEPEEPIVSQFTILEETEDGGADDHHNLPPLPEKEQATSSTGPFKTPINTAADGPKYCWRIDLSKTERFWSGWFKGLSQKFLETPVPKVLLLANIHCLDTALTVGQMQGKFQLQVLKKSGHAIHEDQPEGVADIIGGFLVKQKLAIAKDDFNLHLPCC